MKAKRQKTGLTTQRKTTDYIDPRNPYITRTQDTKKLLGRKSETKIRDQSTRQHHNSRKTLVIKPLKKPQESTNHPQKTCMHAT